MPLTLMYNYKFKEAIVKHIKTTNQAIGPAPQLPHTQMVPLRLAKYQDAVKKYQETSRILPEVYTQTDQQLQVCMDLCFWDQEQFQPGTTYEEMRKSSKQSYRACVDNALTILMLANERSSR